MALLKKKNIHRMTGEEKEGRQKFVGISALALTGGRWPTYAGNRRAVEHYRTA
jgi:hypothetical protein